jgi:hypothetical protein
MFVSEKRLTANRRNAQKSTGPRTPEGKAKVSQNALKHGLYSRRAIITSPRLPENHADYHSLLGVLTAKFAPNSTVEHFLVQRIANFAWQLRRSDRFAGSRLLARMGDLLDSSNPALRAIAQLYHRLLVFNRRLRRRIDQTHSLLLAVKRCQMATQDPQFNAAKRPGPDSMSGVKQSHFPDLVLQLTAANLEKNNRCETKPNGYTRNATQRREAPRSRHMSGCATNPLIERVL